MWIAHEEEQFVDKKFVKINNNYSNLWILNVFHVQFEQYFFHFHFFAEDIKILIFQKGKRKNLWWHRETAHLIFVWGEVWDEFLLTELMSWGNDGSCVIPRILFPRIFTKMLTMIYIFPKQTYKISFNFKLQTSTECWKKNHRFFQTVWVFDEGQNIKTEVGR